LPHCTPILQETIVHPVWNRNLDPHGPSGHSIVRKATLKMNLGFQGMVSSSTRKGKTSTMPMHMIEEEPMVFLTG
jgi:hypothetical protein